MPKNIVVFDLDGTLADGRHRLHLLPNKGNAHKDAAWEAFNMACSDDAPIRDNIMLLRALLHTYHRIVILSGRGEVARKNTLKWLGYYNVDYDELIMRPVGDCRKDIDFKESELRKLGLDNILCCFDDLEHVAKHIRSLGVTCHLVTHYDTPSLAEQPQERK